MIVIENLGYEETPLVINKDLLHTFKVPIDNI